MNIKLLNKVSEQIRQCREKYGNYASFSEAMSILREEFEELWAEHKKHNLDFQRIESEIIDCLTVLFKMHEDIVVKRNDR